MISEISIITAECKGGLSPPLPERDIMIKECLLCGIKVEAVANTRYCRDCAKKMKKNQNQNRKSDHRIPGQSERLSEDIHKANILGLSYGVYISRFRPKEDGRDAFKQKRIL